MPKIEVPTWQHHPGEANSISGQNDGPYAEKVLGDLVGLTQFGVRLERLPPGSRSSHRHWHAAEDEFAYILSGELVLIEETEILLKAGDFVGWAAGQPIAHCLENRSSEDASILIIGTRAESDVVHYPDHDVIFYSDKNGKRFTTLNGDPIEIG
ncbi:MAG: cupin domain-containing protein [Chloroflexota bacterium]